MNARLLLLPLAATLALAGCVPSSNDGADPSPTPVVVKMTFPVAAGEEKTQCLTTRIGNVKAFDYSKVSSVMAGGSHHLILYRDASRQTGGTPPPEGLDDCAMDSARLYVYGAQTSVREERMPAGVAGQLDPDTIVILEAHYANASDQPITAEIEVTLTPADPAQIVHYAGVLFYMDTAFQIPAGAGVGGAPAYSHSTTCPIPEGVNVHRIASHTHKRLAQFDIFHRDVAASADLSKLYENTDWHAPLEVAFPDDAPLKIGASQGFRFDCSWSNETPNAIGYGPSVNDEMCIVAAGYYPRVEGSMAMGGNVFCLDGILYY